jgi:uncharacterized protein (TIGR02217 family)
VSVTILDDIIAPNSLWSAGAQGKNIRRNDRVEMLSGALQVNVSRAITLRQYEIGTVPLSIEQWQTLEGLYEVTDAGAYGFLLQDPKDCTVSDATGRATLIDAGAHTYQLVKRYTAAGSSHTRDRQIKRPRAASFVLKVSGVVISGGSYTLNAATGVVTIPADPSAASITWSGLFYVPVHFENDVIDWDLVVAGAADARFLAGPSVILTEVKE